MFTSADALVPAVLRSDLLQITGTVIPIANSTTREYLSLISCLNGQHGRSMTALTCLWDMAVVAFLLPYEHAVYGHSNIRRRLQLRHVLNCSIFFPAYQSISNLVHHSRSFDLLRNSVKVRDQSCCMQLRQNKSRSELYGNKQAGL